MRNFSIENLLLKKLKMLKESRDEIVKENKKVTDRNDKMANNYMREQITKMIKEIVFILQWSNLLTVQNQRLSS